MLPLIIALLLSMLAVLLIAPKVIPLLKKLKFGQTEYKYALDSHKEKNGTPTMGGLMFAAACCILTLVLVYLCGQNFGFDDFTLVLVAVALLNLLIGFVDDYIKVVKKRNLGLIWWQKILGQIAVSLAFSYYCYRSPYIGSSIIVPFLNIDWDLGVWYVPLMTVFMIFMENSSNLQDGIDGILSSVTVAGAIAIAACALLLPGVLNLSADFAVQYRHIAVFAMALVGGCLGFLWFNYYPAKIFMGDTGSMFIGGAMVGMSLLLRMPIFMIFFSFTSIMSSATVIIQRVYYKLTHGKRVFKNSPIHHHFEMCGMSEPQIVAMYTGTEVLLCLIAVLSIL